MNETTLGDRLYKLRAERDLSYEDMAMLAGVFGSQWYKWENGRTAPTAKSIITICQNLHVSADWLLGLEEAL